MVLLLPYTMQNQRLLVNHRGILHPIMPENESPLGALHDRLYGPKPVDGITADTLIEVAPKKPERWDPEPQAPQKRPPRFSAPVLFLIFAVGFFALAGVIAALVLFLGGRSVSSDRVAITVEGPTSVSGGESVPLLITVTNNNPTAIQGSKLEIAFPDGAFASEDATEPLLSTVEELGEIAPGGSVRRTVHAAFFGEEHTRLTIPITLEYTTEKSSATFVAKKSYGLVISTAPVTLSVTAPTEAPSGQPLTFTLRVRSNAPSAVDNVAVKAEYPFGFTPSDASQKEGLFVVGTLRPGEEKEILVKGPISGEEGEERVFHFSVGTLREAGAKDFSIAYAAKEAAIAITKPFLAVTLGVNGDTDEEVAIKGASTASGAISWQNTLGVPLQDARITIALSGDALDSGSVKASNGFYRSSDRTIVYDGTTNQNLKNLAPGATGSGAFTFSTKTGSALTNLRQPTLTLTVSLSGKREGQDPEEVTSTLTRTVKIMSDVAVTAAAVRSTGPFINTGPWPPLVDQKTTYAIQLSAKASVNTVADSVVTTTLPPYVRFTGSVDPVGAISYDELSRTVRWVAGELAPGTAKTAAFQVELLPSVSQKGTSPLLTSDVTVTGFDRFVRQQVTATVGAPSTQTTSDPLYSSDKGSVK